MEDLMTKSSEAMQSYRKLEDELRRVRSRHALGSVHEDPILEEMARLWWLLTESERETLDREGPTCDPVERVTSMASGS
jgi:hypothetical protein